MKVYIKTTASFTYTKHNGSLISRIEKATNRIFKNNNLKISIEQIVNFLDTTLATDGSVKPYKMTNSNIIYYVNRASNHPRSILRNIPKSIQKRLSSISISTEEFMGAKEGFMGAKEDYQNALQDADYSDKLTCKPIQNTSSQKKKNWNRRTIGSNPTFSKNVY